MTLKAHLTSGLVSALLLLSMVFTAAGGLGLSASVGLIGLCLLPALAIPGLRAIRHAPLLPFLVVVMIAWFCMSFAWSAHDKPDQVYKLALLSPLYISAVYLARQLSLAERSHQLKWICILTVLVGGYFLIEALSGAWIGSWVELNLEQAASPEHATVNAMITHSRGVTAFLMIAAPVGLYLWRSHTRSAHILAGLLAGTGFAASISFEVEANLIAFMAAFGAIACALHWPRRTLQTLLAGFGLWVIGAPVWMATALSVFPESWAESIPFSWEWRLEIWRAVIAEIKQAPILGHGLSATRSMDEFITLRGSEIDVFPHHAHNAGLQIWIETGAVGAFLTSLVLFGLTSAVGRIPMNKDQLMAIAAIVAIWLVSVTIGYGLWQEWHHGALALAVFTALLTPYGRRV